MGDYIYIYKAIYGAIYVDSYRTFLVYQYCVVVEL